MATQPTDMPPQSDASPAGTGVVAAGWLGSQSMFGEVSHAQGKRAAGATAVSIVIHGLFLLLVVWFFTTKAAQVLPVQPMELPRLVYLQQPGPGGGGGGSPAPAPPKPVEIPRSKPVEPIPVPAVTPPPVVPPPQLTAPILTPNATMAQASGTSMVSLAGPGGGGRGTGIGTGTGSGVGPGEGGGFGGGFYQLGSGITNPVPIRTPTPQYTSEAMRAKITGVTVLEAELLANGTVGNVRVTKSLDRGLDQEAIKAAKMWVFQPARDRDGKAVPVLITLELAFRLH